jgi:hypothetical protein
LLVAAAASGPAFSGGRNNMRIESSMIEQDILARIKAAKIRVRFDRVVLRLLGRLRAALTDIVPNEQVVIFTVTAPIRLPVKTAAVLESLVRDGLPCGDRCEVVHGNHVRIRRLTDVPPHVPKVLGFVHAAASDAGIILALAQARLFEHT